MVQIWGNLPLGQSVALCGILWKGRSWQIKAEPGTVRTESGKARYSKVQLGTVLKRPILCYIFEKQALWEYQIWYWESRWKWMKVANVDAAFSINTRSYTCLSVPLSLGWSFWQGRECKTWSYYEIMLMFQKMSDRLPLSEVCVFQSIGDHMGGEEKRGNIWATLHLIWRDSDTEEDKSEQCTS